MNVVLKFNNQLKLWIIAILNQYEQMITMFLSNWELKMNWLIINCC